MFKASEIADAREPEAEAGDVAEVDIEGLSKFYADIPLAPYLVINNASGFELRQIDTDPTNKHHWPFRLVQTIAGQRAGCDEAVFNFLCGVLNAWPEIERRFAATGPGGAGNIVPEVLRRLSEKQDPYATEWFAEHAYTADGLSAIVDGRSHGMFPITGEVPEIKLAVAAVNFVRSLIAAPPPVPSRPNPTVGS